MNTDTDTDTDAELLRSFVAEGDENAFSALVARYAAMVRGVALRCTGEEDLADEVTQTVFTVLTRKASSIPAGHLAGWLHKSASFAALDARRKSRRYQRALADLGRQPDAMNTSEDTAEAASAWTGMRPHLDEAISNLPEKSRGPVILRFFEGKSIREIASASGKSEDASRKELQRALERLSGILKRRGVLTSGAALSVALGAQNLLAPPASAAAVAAAALEAGPSLAATSALLAQTAVFMTTTTKTIAIAAIAVVLTSIPTAILWQENAALKQQMQSSKTVGKIVAASSVRGTAPPAPEQASATQAEMDFKGRPLYGRAKYLPKDGRAPATLLERLRYTFADSRSGMQEMDFARIIGEMQAADAPAILAMLDEVEGERDVEGQRRAVYLHWGEIAPTEALASIKQNRARLSKRNQWVVNEIMQAWAAKDINGALAALNNEEVGGFRDRLLGGLVVTFAGQDLAKCTTWALTQDKEDLKQCGTALGWVAATTFGVETGNTWYKNLPNDGPGGVKEWAWQGVSKTAEKTGGRALMDLIVSSADLPWCQPAQVAGGLKAAAAQGVTAGLDYLTTLPPGGLQKLSGNHLGAVFQESSFAEAEAWLKSNRNAAGYDFLAAEFAKVRAKAGANP